MKKIVFVTVLAVLILAGATAWLFAGPTIGTVAATPMVIGVSTPTMVTVTAEIIDPSLIPTSANLLKLNAAGRPVVVLGSLHDDGKNGDAIANDKIYSLRIILTEPAPTPVRLQISAAFKGLMRRVLSNPISITVSDISLPPDPGAAGRLTLAGIDSDLDGLRDDIQRYIALNYIDSPKTRAGLTQAARAIHTALVQASDKAASVNNATALQRSIECLHYFLPDDAAKAAKDRLIAEMLNTRARTEAYLTFDRQLAGQIFPGTPLRLLKTACSFNPDVFTNF